MRLVLQRVSSASVSIAERGMIGSIQKGVCVLIGIGDEDGDREVAWAHEAILNAKLWEDAEGRPWKLNAKDINAGVLLVSQFTLYGKWVKKGKLDFHHAMPPDVARGMYDTIVTNVQGMVGTDNVQTGEFGAMMEVQHSNVPYSTDNVVVS